MLPFVYIIILNWNGKDDLLTTLQSVNQITYPRAKILVVDNGSTDGSLIAGQRQFPTVECIQTGANLGFGGGNNFGIRHALNNGADYVLVLGNDTRVDPHFVTALMEMAESDPRIGVVGPKIYEFTMPNKIWFAGGGINFWLGLTWHMGLRRLDRGQFDQPADVGYITGCAMLVRREVIESVGMFDEMYYPAYVEDADWNVRIKRAGYRIVYVPAAKIWHKISASTGGGLTPLKTYLKVRNSFRFFRRYARWYQWPTIALTISSGALVFIFIQLFRRKFRIIRALMWGFIDTLSGQERREFSFLYT